MKYKVGDKIRFGSGGWAAEIIGVDAARKYPYEAKMPGHSSFLFSDTTLAKAISDEDYLRQIILDSAGVND